MRHFLKDFIIILFSIALAIAIVGSDLIDRLLTLSEGIGIFGSFIAGLFFTSIFTTAPAIVVLGAISRSEPLLVVASVGAAGALIGDLLIFYMFKDHIADDLDGILEKIKDNPTRFIFSRKFRWLSVAIGALIIASPLPDELGIAMMGVSRIRTNLFVPVSFALNFLGIILIGLAARAII